MTSFGSKLLERRRSKLLNLNGIEARIYPIPALEMIQLAGMSSDEKEEDGIKSIERVYERNPGLLGRILVSCCVDASSGDRMTAEEAAQLPFDLMARVLQTAQELSAPEEDAGEQSLKALSE